MKADNYMYIYVFFVCCNVVVYLLLPSHQHGSEFHQQSLLQQFGKHVPNLFLHADCMYGDFIFLLVCLEMMIVVVQMLCSWSYFGQPNKFQCSAIVLKGLAVNFWRMKLKVYVLRHQLLCQLHQWYLIMEG